MASMHGFKVTSMRSWDAMEGVGTSGILHWNSKRLGEFVDDGNGGCVRYLFPFAHRLSELVAEQLPNLCAEIYGEEASWMTPDLDTLVLAICDLAETEKGLRRAFSKAKRDGKILVTGVEESGDYRLFAVPDTPAYVKAAKDRMAGCHDIHVWRKSPALSVRDGERVTDRKVADDVQTYVAARASM